MWHKDASLYEAAQTAPHIYMAVKALFPNIHALFSNTAIIHPDNQLSIKDQKQTQWSH